MMSENTGAERARENTRKSDTGIILKRGLKQKIIILRGKGGD